MVRPSERASDRPSFSPPLVSAACGVVLMAAPTHSVPVLHSLLVVQQSPLLVCANLRDKLRKRHTPTFESEKGGERNEESDERQIANDYQNARWRVALKSLMVLQRRVLQWPVADRFLLVNLLIRLIGLRVIVKNRQN